MASMNGNDLLTLTIDRPANGRTILGAVPELLLISARRAVDAGSDGAAFQGNRLVVRFAPVIASGSSQRRGLGQSQPERPLILLSAHGLGADHPAAIVAG